MLRQLWTNIKKKFTKKSKATGEQQQQEFRDAWKIAEYDAQCEALSKSQIDYMMACQNATTDSHSLSDYRNTWNDPILLEPPINQSLLDELFPPIDVFTHLKYEASECAFLNPSEINDIVSRPLPEAPGTESYHFTINQKELDELFPPIYVDDYGIAMRNMRPNLSAGAINMIHQDPYTNKDCEDLWPMIG